MPANIPLEVLHRGGFYGQRWHGYTPHNGAVITLLAITGLSHRQAYGGIFHHDHQSLAVLFVIAVFYLPALCKENKMNLNGKTVTGSTSGIGQGTPAYWQRPERS